MVVVIQRRQFPAVPDVTGDHFHPCQVSVKLRREDVDAVLRETNTCALLYAVR